MASQKLTPLQTNHAKAVSLIDEAHARDPNKIPSTDGSGDVPYELHYAQKMTRWLAERCPDASPTLQIACRAQHFRRYRASPLSRAEIGGKSPSPPHYGTRR